MKTRSNIAIGLISVLLFVLSFSIQAQDPQFTQFFYAPIYLNPALTGTTEQFRISALHRSQWLALDARYQSTQAAFDVNLPHLRSGLGFMVSNDLAGRQNLQTVNTGLLYSFLAPLSRQLHLRLGIQGNLVNRHIDFTNLVFSSQVRPDEASVWEGTNGGSRTFADFSVGFLLYSPSLWLGGAVHHLNQPDQSLAGTEASLLPRKYSLHGGANLTFNTLNGDFYLMPSLLYKKQGPVDQLDIGMRFMTEWLPVAFGLAYRGIPVAGNTFNYARHDAIAGIVGLHTGSFVLGYSYDFTISGIQPYSGGSHEISLVYQWGTLQGKGRQGIQCPLYEKAGPRSWNMR